MPPKAPLAETEAELPRGDTGVPVRRVELLGVPIERPGLVAALTTFAVASTAVVAFYNYHK